MLQAKLERGDLAEQVEYLWGRERAIEYNLLEEAVSSSRRRRSRCSGSSRRSSSASAPKPTCGHRAVGEPFGPAMMIAVQDRLKHLAETRSRSGSATSHMTASSG